MNNEQIKNQIVAIKLAQVEIPTTEENTRNAWIEFGKNNAFPDYLLELMKRSALHNAILVSKSGG